MQKIRRKKSFDAIKMKREIQAKVMAETQHMNFEQLRAYIRQKLAEAPSSHSDLNT